MSESKELPKWAVAGSIAAVVIVVVALFAKGANGGDASKDELMQIRNNQRGFASGSAPAAGTAQAGTRAGEMPLGGPGAPPGAVVTPGQG
jgi:hypothetical protein